MRERSVEYRLASPISKVASFLFFHSRDGNILRLFEPHFVPYCCPLNVKVVQFLSIYFVLYYSGKHTSVYLSAANILKRIGITWNTKKNVILDNWVDYGRLIVVAKCSRKKIMTIVGSYSHLGARPLKLWGQLHNDSLAK